MLALRAVPNSQFLIKLSVFEKITKHIFEEVGGGRGRDGARDEIRAKRAKFLRTTSCRLA